MTKGSQAKIIAAIFAAGALALLAAICNDLLKPRTLQAVGTSPPASDADRPSWPARNPKASTH